MISICTANPAKVESLTIFSELRVIITRNCYFIICLSIDCCVSEVLIIPVTKIKRGTIT